MAQLTLSRQAQQVLGIGLPLAALGVSIGMVYPTWGRYQALGRQLETRSSELAALRAAPPQQPGQSRVAAADVPDESVEFVGDITRLAAGSGCEVTGLDVVAAEGKSGVARPKRAKLTIRGRYPQARSFLYRLTQSPRAYVVADLSLIVDSKISGSGAGAPLSLTLTIERYVAPPAFLATASAPPE
jgi:hypothetical protein